MTTIVMKADAARAALWKSIFAERAADIDFRIWPEIGNPADVDCLLTWDVPDDLKTTFPQLKFVHTIGAGVDHVDLSRLPADVELVRMVEPGIKSAMNEWVVMAVLSAHRRLPEYIAQQRNHVWAELPAPPASARCIGLMGAGVLGESALAALRPFGFEIATWSRTRKSIGADQEFAGDSELEAFLAKTNILVCLIPLTPTSRGILNQRVFAALPKGAIVINVSRGGNLVVDDLLAALDSGHLGGAILDVFDPQPPPADHPAWDNPKVMMTPHIATRTQAHSGAAAVIANVRRWESGKPLENTVNRTHGY